ncbi:MAG: hypothetical protein ACF8AM_21885, partial [Rhodopirellula sp. JB055]|uniref:hypothetical protein n=1 Tax=Rhodopirellula sp. JB055 TaxID=3342846 RepID=UPI00370C7995
MEWLINQQDAPRRVICLNNLKKCWLLRPRLLKLRFSQIPKRQLPHNPKRQRGKNDVDFASLTRRDIKKQCLTLKRNFKRR